MSIAKSGSFGVSFFCQLPANSAMQCPPCKTQLEEDSLHCQRCGRSLDNARRLDLWLDRGGARSVQLCRSALAVPCG